MGIVILDKKDYYLEMFRILNDLNTYRPLPKDPTFEYKNTLVGLVVKEVQLGILDKKEKEYLVPLAPRIPIIYYLPKVHMDALHPTGIPLLAELVPSRPV